jgi:hypothetical protein
MNAAWPNADSAAILPAGNHSVATVGVMNAAELDLPHRPRLGVRPGESDPAAMLGRVLLLLMAIVVMAALGLVWWLA